MLVAEAYDEFFRSTKDLPQYASDRLSRFFLDRFTGRREDLFVELSLDLPKIYAALASNFANPAIGIRYVGGKRKFDLVFEGANSCVVADLQARDFYDLYDFDEEYKMLPEKIRSYYRVTEGFQIVTDPAAPAYVWKNLPLSLIRRVSVSEMATLPECSQESIRRLPTDMNLVVWMYSDDGDVILVDENTSVVFHSRSAQIEDLFELREPELTWDQYCSHMLSGGNSAEFSFR